MELIFQRNSDGHGLAFSSAEMKGNFSSGRSKRKEQEEKKKKEKKEKRKKGFFSPGLCKY